MCYWEDIINCMQKWQILEKPEKSSDFKLPLFQNKVKNLSHYLCRFCILNSESKGHKRSICQFCLYNKNESHKYVYIITDILKFYIVYLWK